jgi:hypothetical protein
MRSMTASRSVLAATLLALVHFAVVDPAHAQPARDPISDSVGSTSGEFRVDESGGATYSIPLYVAPGVAGTAPTVMNLIS